MEQLKKYLRYMSLNSTIEMDSAMKIVLYIISMGVFSLILILFILFSGKVLETIAMIIATVVLILMILLIIYIFVKAIYDTIKLTIKWFKNK